jgi:transcriptional regulator with XRE-family HTH domain
VRVVIDEASRRLLGAELRALRERAGRTLEHAAARLECSLAKVSRIETGRVAVRPLDLRELLDCYEVGGARRAALLSVVRQQRRTDWWREYADIIYDGYDLYIGYEDEATEIWEYQPQWIPGLLQTGDYAAALAMAYGAPPHDATRYADLRQARQAILLRDDPPRLTVVLDESVLLRPSTTTGLMRDQLRHLVDAAARPTVSVRVLPLSAGMHPAQNGAFIVLGFAPEDGRLAYTNSLTEGRLSHDDTTVGRYVTAFDRLRELALSEVDSVAFVEGALAHH